MELLYRLRRDAYQDPEVLQLGIEGIDLFALPQQVPGVEAKGGATGALDRPYAMPM